MCGAARERLPGDPPRRGTWKPVGCISERPWVVYNDGRVGEIFLSNTCVNSSADIMASDAAVVASVALQFGVPLDVIRCALMRDSHGRPSGPLAVVLGQLAEEGNRRPTQPPARPNPHPRQQARKPLLPRRKNFAVQRRAPGPLRRGVLEHLVDLVDADPQSVADILAALPAGTTRRTAETAIKREFDAGRILRIAPGNLRACSTEAAAGGTAP